MTLRRLLPFLAMLAAFGWIVPASAASTGKLGSGCIAHHPNYIEDTFEVQYSAGCSGHDEPELDPVSSAPGSARDLTWRFVLPSDGSFNVSATGPPRIETSIIGTWKGSRTTRHGVGSSGLVKFHVRYGVVVFPGSNCERDALQRTSRALGPDTRPHRGSRSGVIPEHWPRRVLCLAGRL